MCGEIRKPCQPSKLRTDCYVNDSTGVLQTFKRRMLSISSKRENNVSPTYSEWCSFNSYVGWLQHCDSFRLYQKYVEPNVEYMHNYYLKEVKGNAEICKRKNYSGERKAS